MSTSSSCSSSPKEVISTAFHEKQIIMDLQKQLQQLAQHNRECVAKALSAAELTPTLTSAAETRQGTVPQPNNAVQPPTDARLEKTFSTSTHPSRLPEVLNVMQHSDPHSLTLSRSNPLCYPSLDHHDTKSMLVDSGGCNKQVHTLEGVDAMNVIKIHRNSGAEVGGASTFPTGLEKQLYDAKAQVFQLDTKLKECNDICEQQKLLFRTAIVDLQTKLNDTIVGRNSVLELRRKEAESQERLINQMQRTFADVEVANQHQVQGLQDVSRKVTSLQGELQACITTLTQINTLVVLNITKRGLTFIQHSATYSSIIDSESVVKTLKELLEWYEKELDEMRRKVGDAEKSLIDAQEQFQENLRKTGEDHKQILCRLSEENECQLSAATERALNARKQILSLQSQLALTKEHIQQQLDEMSNRENEHQHKLNQVQEHAEHLQTKCDTLSSDLMEAQHLHKETTQEKDQILDKMQSLESQLAASKASLAKTEVDAHTAHEQNRLLTSLEQEASTKVSSLKMQLEQKTSYCEELSRLVEETREDSAKQIEEKDLAKEEEHNQQMTSLARDFTSRINCATIQCKTLAGELKQKDRELQDMLESKHDLTGTLGQVREEFQGVVEEKTTMCLILGERAKELQILQQERECLKASLEERNNELNATKHLRAKLEVQVDEKAIECERLHDQISSMAHQTEVARKTSEHWNQEQAQLKSKLEEQTKELKDVTLRYERIQRKMKAQEKRVHLIEQDNERIQKEIKGATMESKTIIKSKEELTSQLLQAKTQVDILGLEQEKLKAENLMAEQSHKQDINKYKAKMTRLQEELHTAHSTIKAMAASDSKAVEVAEIMQKHVTASRSEIDTLHSEIHWLKECLDIIRKEKSSLVGECDHYKAQMSALNKHVKNLTKEQQIITSKRNQQSGLISKLEESIIKAAAKFGECQAIIEGQEQDIARLKLKHQLEIKEVQRATARSSSTENATKSANLKSSTLNILPHHTKEISNMQSTSISRRLHTGTTELKTIERDQVISRGTLTSLTEKGALAQLLPDDEELNKLLQKMHNVVSSQTNIHNSQNGPKDGPSSQVHSRFGVPGSRSSRESGYNSRLQDSQDKPGMTAPLLTSSPVTAIPHVPVSGNRSPLSPVQEATGDSLQMYPKLDFLHRSMSPVANLLSVSPLDTSVVHQDNNSRNNDDTQSGAIALNPFESLQICRVPDVSLRDKNNTSSANSTASLSSERNMNTKAQSENLRLLHTKLHSLSKMGGHLQKENEDMALMIKRQDSQLKKCRQHEQSVHQLASKSR